MTSSQPTRRLLLAAAIGSLAAACGTPAPTTYDLSAPRDVRGGRRGIQLIVAEPIALQALADQRILVKDEAGAISFIGGGQWSDGLTRLVQARMIQTIENARSVAAVGRAGDRLTPDYQLTSDIRAFEIRPGTGEAVVEISVKLISEQTGRVVRSRILAGRVAGSASDAGRAAAALDEAFAQVLRELVRFVG